MDEMQRDRYTGRPDATAAEQVQGVIIAATGQVERKDLSSMSYKLRVKDQHGNEVEIEGEIFGRVD